MGREFDAGGAIIEFHKCLVIPESWCTTDELGESWAVKIDLIEEGGTEVIEFGGVDVGHEVLYIFDNPFEIKLVERGDDRTV